MIRMKHGFKYVLFAGALSLASMQAHADETESSASVITADASRLSLDFGSDVTSEYFFRGYLQEDQGFIAQPWAELGVSLVDPGDTGGAAVDAYFGIWNSFHSHHTGSAGAGQESWYEADLYGGVTFGWETFEVGLSYTFYTYPNDSSFDTVQELGLTLGVDLPDDEWSGQWLGDLSFGVHFETDNSNVGDDEAAYFQFDFGPSFDIFNGNATLSIPVSVGFSVDDYYVGDDDETFGFASVGAAVEVPLNWSGFGDVALTAGVSVQFLGDTAEAANGGDDTAAFAFAGIAFSF